MAIYPKIYPKQQNGNKNGLNLARKMMPNDGGKLL
jgi:hypothetical protein